ncbi:haloacid dehalogenase-like hydrolase domain-containing protein At2g33255 isoform X2 [Lotus japonicus]|uniref:haloacid dehalogenase-like hydrolase domain-containing protein At2g33255 isoform X2 n=1 Tax=Lotus japonicus TaxID=34305 RepID=UPI00258DAF9D|nr:haloacid dehalogenase-like hydrolase domain-containing protein At2g33255 isoform X2 [Lotus japonicus]
MLSTTITRAFLSLSSTLPRHAAATRTMSTTTTKTPLRGVVFDMDGTLTIPVIDFPAMYRAVLGDDEYRRIKAQSPSGIDILSHIDRWPQHQQQQAYDTIADFERQALLHLQIMPGAADLCRLLDSKQIRRGLITRNVKSAVDIFHERFGVVCGRQAGAFTCLLDQTGRYDSFHYANVGFKPDFKVTSLAEVYSILEANFDLSL